MDLIIGKEYEVFHGWGAFDGLPDGRTWKHMVYEGLSSDGKHRFRSAAPERGCTVMGAVHKVVARVGNGKLRERVREVHAEDGDK